MILVYVSGDIKDNRHSSRYVLSSGSSCVLVFQSCNSPVDVE